MDVLVREKCAAEMLLHDNPVLHLHLTILRAPFYAAYISILCMVPGRPFTLALNWGMHVLPTQAPIVMHTAKTGRVVLSFAPIYRAVIRDAPHGES
jgi:hypothetical protein